MTVHEFLDYRRGGRRLSPQAAQRLVHLDDLDGLMRLAAACRDEGHGDIVSYSRKVFIPLTKLCRDVCHYCRFAQPPRAGEPVFLSREQILDIARAGAKAGCREALFTLGDKPEMRYRAAREALLDLGHETTLSYLKEAAGLVLKETGLLPHLNPGIMAPADYAALRPVSVSMGLMLESTAERLCEKDGAHFGSPDKDPALRLSSIEAAGRAKVPFTTGLLIGIGETRGERIEALLAIRDLHDKYGHIQEVIIQNFRPKPGTRMSGWAEPSEQELLWTIAAARLILGAEMNIQSPPNLNAGRLGRLIAAGVNDWGGVSPVTPDHVNPECRWPELDALAQQTKKAGKELVERIAVYPGYALAGDEWTDHSASPFMLSAIDGEGFARTDDWRAGISKTPPASAANYAPALSNARLDRLLARAEGGSCLTEAEITSLLSARGGALAEIRHAANELRKSAVGDDVTFVVNCNLNYTNICSFRCGFCAFSKGAVRDGGRDRPYMLDLAEIEQRVADAAERGASEICLQGGIHPSFTGMTYLNICRAVKRAAPGIHVHAFSPLEVWHGATSLDISVERFLGMLTESGLDSMPGTAAEILNDDVRRIICPDKINTETWLDVVRTAHRAGLPTTSTMMFGHVDEPRHRARHLLRLRRLQEETGGLSEFVPLPFVGAEAPMFKKGLARPGATYREALLVHAVARIALHGLVPNIQTSWVKMGKAGALDCLNAGANDFGGVLMHESITRAAGATHGQEVTAGDLSTLIASINRTPVQRTTLYGVAGFQSECCESRMPIQPKEKEDASQDIVAAE